MQRLHASKPLHGPFSSSKRLMRILGAIVKPTTGLPAIGVADLFHRRGIRAKPVGDDAQRSAIFLHDACSRGMRRASTKANNNRRISRSIAGAGSVRIGGETVARAAYDFDGFAAPGGGVMGSGEIRLAPSDLEAVFGGLGVQLLTDETAAFPRFEIL